VDRIKRLSYEVLEKHKSKFGEDFANNKKSLDEVAIVRSKGLKNEIAGYITKFIKRENREKEIKQSKADKSIDESTPIEETVKIETEHTPESEEKVIEIGVDTTDVTETDDPSEEKVIEVGVDTTDVTKTNEPSEEKTE
jgi:small subunit ribosomal protein S17e